MIVVIIKIVYLNSYDSLHWYRATPDIGTGWRMKALTASLPRRTWGYWWVKSWIWATSVSSQPRRPTVSWAASKEAWPAGRGRWFCSSALPWWDPAGSTGFSSGAPSTRSTWKYWNGSRGGPQRRSEGWNTSLTRAGWESWCCSAWRREGFCKTLLWPFST